jgi:thiamine phosphate synthase YjbQ (UPF0047 family)
MVVTCKREVPTRGQGDTHDITDLVSAAVAESTCAAGIATVFIVGSTAAVTTIEFEPGAVADLNRSLESIAPRDADYRITCDGATTTDRATFAPPWSDHRSPSQSSTAS